MVTTLRSPTPSTLYQQEYCGRGQAENGIKQVKCDLKSDRTSASTFIANFGRLLLTAAAYVLHQQLRQLGLQGTRLANAQPKTVILSLFKMAVRIKPYKIACTCLRPARSNQYWHRQINTGTGKLIRAKVCQRLCPVGRKPAMRASP